MIEKISMMNGIEYMKQIRQRRYISLYKLFSLAAVSKPLILGLPNVKGKVGSDRPRADHAVGGCSPYSHEPFHKPLIVSFGQGLRPPPSSAIIDEKPQTCLGRSRQCLWCVILGTLC